MNIKEILKLHELWLEDDPKGKMADLSEADLSGANLKGAKLFEANLFEANLTGANLTEADLRGANLEGAKLSGAKLSGANLTGANLRGANLVGARLAEANLVGARLLEANLEGIKGKEIKTFEGNRHFAYSCDGFIKIGCICKTIGWWVANYEEIGKKEGYSDEDIKEYGEFIRSLV